MALGPGSGYSGPVQAWAGHAASLGFVPAVALRGLTVCASLAGAWCPDMWSTIILGILVQVFLDEIYIQSVGFEQSRVPSVSEPLPVTCRLNRTTH